jgi:predicted GNAT family acetyltransferase
MEEKVIHDKTKLHFVIVIDGKESLVDYSIEKKKMNLYHTYTHPDLRGKGLAAKVVIAALEYAKENNLKVIPGCSYVQDFIAKNKKYNELVAE